MREFILQTYIISLPVILGYIAWLLKNQKKYRDANGKGTMLLLKIQLIEYHSKYTEVGYIPSYAYQTFLRNIRSVSCALRKRDGNENERRN